MGALLVCAQRGNASKRSPNAPTIADAATLLHAVFADETAVLIECLNGKTHFSTIMMR
jgi:hypothetical protein